MPSTAPVMAVAFLRGTATSLFGRLRRAGHNVSILGNPEDAASFDALVLDVPAPELMDSVLDLLPHVRAGQIIIHTVADQPVEALRPLSDYLTHCAVVCPLDIDAHWWFVRGLDEISEEVARLILMDPAACLEPVELFPAGPSTAHHARDLVEALRSTVEELRREVGAAGARRAAGRLVEQFTAED